MSIRPDLGETIEKRREKGVLKALEELQSEVGEWGESMEIISSGQGNEFSEEHQHTMLALMYDIQAALDLLIGSLEKLTNLAGGNSEIMIDYFEELNKTLDQVFACSEKTESKEA